MFRTALSVGALIGGLGVVVSGAPGARGAESWLARLAGERWTSPSALHIGLDDQPAPPAALNDDPAVTPVSENADAERAAKVEKAVKEESTPKEEPKGGATKEDQAGEDRVPAGTVTQSENSNPTDMPEVAKPEQEEEGVPGQAKEDPAAKPLPAAPQEILSPDAEALRDKVRRCLMLHYHDPITTGDHTPWGIMHVLIAYGVDTEIIAGNRRVNAIGWLCYNGACRGMKLMHVENGKLRVKIGPGVQGHPGQFLAMLAQCRVRPDYPIKVDGRDFTVADLIESEKETCRARTELTFKLIALSHYLKTDATWKSDIGEEWNLQRLIKEELAQPVVGAACGGSHRMTGFSYAVNKRTKMAEPFDGQWLRAQKFVGAYHDYLFRLQNEDGSFSSNWFAGRADWGDDKRVVETTGHMLEWAVASFPKEQLDDPRIVKAVNRLVDALMDGRKNRVQYPVGPRGHALHGLALYNERRFGDLPGSRDLVLARRATAADGVRVSEGSTKGETPKSR